MATKRREQINEAVKKIRTFHQLGRKVQRLRHTAIFGQHQIDTEAIKLRINPDTLRKARQFAEYYNQSELNELCSYCRAEQLRMEPHQSVFGRSHVIRLVSIGSKKERLRVQRVAITNAWSVAELDEEIAKRFGRRRKGGRRPRIPAERTALLIQLDGMCETWLRWHQNAARTPGEREEEAPVPLTCLSPRVKRIVAEVSEDLRRLQTIIERTRKRI